MVDDHFLQDGLHQMISHVIEECGEVLAAAGKLQRWGPESTNPLTDDDTTNIQWMYNELLDLRITSQRLILRIETMYGISDQ